MIRRRANRGVRRATGVSLSLHTEGRADAVDRALDETRKIAEDAASGALASASLPFDVDLVVGTTKIDHGLDRPIQMILWVPQDAGSAAPGFDPQQTGNPNPRRQVWVTSTVAARYRFILL